MIWFLSEYEVFYAPSTLVYYEWLGIVIRVTVQRMLALHFSGVWLRDQPVFGFRIYIRT